MHLAVRRMVWRTLLRHRQRTVLMISIVAMGSLVIVLLFGLSDGIVASMTASQMDFNQGGFQVRVAGSGTDPVAVDAMSPEQVTAAREALDGLGGLTIAERFESVGMIHTAQATDSIRLRGIDPASESMVTRLDDRIVRGKYLDDAGQVLLSATLVEKHDIRVGERVVLHAMSNQGAATRAFRLTGVFEAATGDLERVAMLCIDDARGLTGIDGSTALAVGLPRGMSANRTADRARQLLAGQAGIEVADYYDLNPLARFMAAGSRIRMIPFVLMISLMAGFGVANTALYSVLERTREFGVMAAVGMSRRLLAQLVLLESSLVAALGFLVGGSMGYWALVHLCRNGIDVSFLSDMGGSLGLPRVLYASTSGWYVVAAFSVVVLTALFAAWHPARRLNRLDPVQAIREG